MFETDRRAFLGQSAGALAAMALMPSNVFAFNFKAQGARVALIGAGRQGRAIVGELQKMEGVSVTAVCDVDKSRLDSGLRRTRGAEGFESVEALLNKGSLFDAVCIATPTHTHREVAEACLGAGKHVYCEAPLEATIEDAAAIVRAARASTGVFHVGLMARSNPVYQLARTFFRSDAVRHLVAIDSQSRRKISWRYPASDPARDKALNWKLDPEVSLGLPGEWGVHQFDAVAWFTGRYPERARGIGSIQLWNDGREIADTVACHLVYSDKVVMSYDATLANSYGQSFDSLIGTNAAIKLAETHAWMFKEADAPTQGWEVYANRQQFFNDEGITLIAGATKLADQGKLQEGVGLPHPGMYYALGDFLKSVTEGAPVACSAEEGYRSTVVAIAAGNAVKRGEEVEITSDQLRV